MIDSGKAREKIEHVREVSQRLASKAQAAPA